MKILNPFRVNDWPIKKFKILVFSIQVAVLGLICLDLIGLNIILLRYIVGFFYLTFLPGLLLLRIFNLHKLGNIETILYTVGLSIFTLMFMGLAAHFLFPLLGVNNPLSPINLIFVNYLVNLILSIICFAVDDYSNSEIIDFNIFDTPLCFLLLLPFLSIFGTYSKNFFGHNQILIFLLMLICVVVISIGFGVLIPKHLYPACIFLISVSLLYHTSLISEYLWGTDIQREFYVGNMILNSGVWDISIGSSLYSVLSITILAPTYSAFLDIDIKWLFKVIYPLIFSLVPLGMYRLFEKQTDETIAFFSCFFFVSVAPFYTVMLEATRQQISELFFVLVLLLFVSNEIESAKRSLLIVIFSFSLAVSHYGLSYLYMFSIIFMWISFFFYDKKYSYLHLLSRELLVRTNISERKDRYVHVGNSYGNLNLTFVLLILTFTLGWYMYVSNSSVFNIIVKIFNDMFSSIKTGFFDPDEVEALKVIADDTSFTHIITKCLHLLIQFLIFIGILTSSTSRNKLENEFFVMSLFFFGICVISLAVPGTSVSMGTSRTYSICLIPLALFCILGFINMSSWLSKILYINVQSENIFFKFLSIFLAIFLIFNSGLASHIGQDEPTSISLDEVRHPRLVYADSDFYGIKWAIYNKDKNNFHIYSGLCDKYLIYNFMDDREVNLFNSNTTLIHPNSYIILGPLSVQDHEIVNAQIDKSGSRWEYLPLNNSIFYKEVISKSNKIYNNGEINIL